MSIQRDIYSLSVESSKTLFSVSNLPISRYTENTFGFITNINLSIKIDELIFSSRVLTFKNRFNASVTVNLHGFVVNDSGYYAVSFDSFADSLNDAFASYQTDSSIIDFYLDRKDGKFIAYISKAVTGSLFTGNKEIQYVLSRIFGVNENMEFFNGTNLTLNYSNDPIIGVTTNNNFKFNNVLSAQNSVIKNIPPALSTQYKLEVDEFNLYNGSIKLKLNGGIQSNAESTLFQYGQTVDESILLTTQLKSNILQYEAFELIPIVFKNFRFVDVYIYLIIDVYIGGDLVSITPVLFSGIIKFLVNY